MLDTFAPLKTIYKYKLRLRSEPWIALGLQKSISVKNKLLNKFNNKEDTILKEEIHIKYKNYEELSTLIKKSKQASYNKYFETNWINIKNT